MDPCECLDLLNSQALIGHILNFVNSQTECTDSHCFTRDEGPLSERLDPSSSLVTIGVAFVALIMLVVILPMNVRRRRRHTTDKKNGEGPNGRGNGGNGPNLAL
ncbi:hypothetical protein TYRP_019592 [Tyrophagus putrescentiae]|nr:hypothetical protein TYRP_019592 [Tyrophagus putrescentiae]